MVFLKSGVFVVGKQVEISVLLNYEKTRKEGIDLSTAQDRFQVLGIAVENPSSPDELMKLWQTTPEDKLFKTIVKCKFVPPNMVRTMDASDKSPKMGGMMNTPNSSLMLSPEPDMEQAKSVFKQEMAVTKLKKEVKGLKEENEALKQQMAEKDEALADMLKELAQTKSGNTNNRKAGTCSGLMYVLLYLLVLALFFVVSYKAFGYDPLLSIYPDFSLTKLERRYLFKKK